MDVYDCSTHCLIKATKSRRRHGVAFATAVFADIAPKLNTRNVPSHVAANREAKEETKTETKSEGAKKGKGGKIETGTAPAAPPTPSTAPRASMTVQRESMCSKCGMTDRVEHRAQRHTHDVDDVYNLRTHKLQPVTLSCRNHAIAFARAVFAAADHHHTGGNGDGVLTRQELETYFSAHPREEAQILGEKGSVFTWDRFFSKMLFMNVDVDGDGDIDEDDRAFNITTWTDAVIGAHR